MKFKIGDFVTPLVKSKGYILGDHERQAGKYYEIVKIDNGRTQVKLEGNYAGWLNVGDVKLRKEKPENYSYLTKLLKKLNII